MPAIERRLIDTTATYLARHGGPVTAQLLSRLDDDLVLVLGELEREASERRQWSHDALALARLAELDAAVAASHPDVEAAIREGVRYLEHLSEADLRDLSRRLVDELRAGVLQPLRQAVTDAVELLSHAETTSVNGRPPVVRSWPAANELPNRFQPAVNERLLEPAGDYPQKLRGIVATTVGTREEPAMRTAVQEILAGILPSSTEESPEQRLIDIRVPWVPGDPQVLEDPGAAKTRGEYRLALRPEDILDRAEEWLDRPDTAVGRFVHETIGDYLRGEGAEAERRRERFTSELAATLDLADPLVQINVGVLGQVHRGRTEPAIHRILAPLPFGTGHPARAAVRDLLLTRGWTDANVDGVFADTDKEEIDVFAMLAEPYEPVVFDSLMRPIAEEWGARSGNPDSRSAFWRWRRTRPLPQALPMTESVRAAMVRGWFTANLLGQVRTAGSGATSIFMPSGTNAPGTWAEFPYPFLGEMHAEHERLPAILKSSMLAMLNANTQRTLAPLDPYARLRRLGSSGAAGAVDNYDVLNDELANWLLDGRLPTGAPVPRQDVAGALDSTAEQRARAIVARLEKQWTAYRGLFDKTDSRSDEFDVLRAWELRDDYRNAFNAMVRAIGHAMTTAEDRDVW